MGSPGFIQGPPSFGTVDLVRTCSGGFTGHADGQAQITLENTLLAGIAAGFANAQSRFLKCCFRIGKELTNFFWFCAGNPTFEHSTDLPEDVNNRRQP